MVFFAVSVLLALQDKPLEPVEVAGLHNVFRVSARLYSGSSPETAEAFKALKQLGVKTIMSVDGARPPVELARAEGLRYVHLPVAYEGIPRATVLRLVKAVQTQQGPIYLHCHHGQHRGPAAAAITHYCLDPSWTAQQAIKIMEQAGTDPHYKGLFQLPLTIARPSEAELARVSTDFPEVAPVPALASVMVKIDATWDNLKLIEQAKWKAPPGHADLDPAHEALQLVEHIREAARLPAATSRGPAFLKSLAEAARTAETLEQTLRQPDQPTRPDRLRATMAQGTQHCAACHRQYRDDPSR